MAEWERYGGAKDSASQDYNPPAKLAVKMQEKSLLDSIYWTEGWKFRGCFQHSDFIEKEKESKNAAGTAVGAKEMSPILYGSFKKEW